MSVRISVIITTYNSELYIDRLINSIMKQEGNHSLFEIEFLIVDDCSTDRTVEKIKQLGLNFLSTAKNSGGPNEGRNIGLERATGEYICIVDHDDEWCIDRVKKMLPFFSRTQIVTCGFKTVDEKTGKSRVSSCNGTNGANHRYYARNVTFLNKLRRNKKSQNTYLGGIMFSTVLRHIHFEKTFGMVDYDWLLRLFHHQDSIEVCQALYTRHVEGSNLSLNEKYRLKDYAYSMESVEKYQQLYPRAVKKSVKRINGSLARYYFLIDHMSMSRKYFLRSEINLLTCLYLITSFVGSTVVKRKFKVFG